MNEGKPYRTGAAFRTALEDRLKRIAREESVDLQRLRRQVAFDRFLARLFRVVPSDWILKGGYEMEIWFQTARATRDLDFTLKTMPAGTADAILASLQDIGAQDIGDFFTFSVEAAAMELAGAPYGGARYPVDATMAGRIFVKFHVDVGVGDVVVDPVETVQTRDWLSFAGLPAPAIRVIQREQQFAEKLHAYTLPRQGAPNSRVRDILDLILLVRSGTLDSTRIRAALHRTFARRNTHRLPAQLDEPPLDWGLPFATMAEECSIKVSLGDAFTEVESFYRQVNLAE
jgi:hypothetical protein